MYKNKIIAFHIDSVFTYKWFYTSSLFEETSMFYLIILSWSLPLSGGKKCPHATWFMQIVQKQ